MKTKEDYIKELLKLSKDELYILLAETPTGKTKVFKMLMEPHTPTNTKNPCEECILQSGPMCMDRSYCEFRQTGKTWKKHLEKEDSDE